jgi:phage gp45-like
MTDQNGNVRTAISGAFGYYRFEDVAAGETYVITATGKRFKFEQSSQVLNVEEETIDVNFIGVGSSKS